MEPGLILVIEKRAIDGVAQVRDREDDGAGAFEGGYLRRMGEKVRETDRAFVNPPDRSRRAGQLEHLRRGEDGIADRHVDGDRQRRIEVFGKPRSR